MSVEATDEQAAGTGKKRSRLLVAGSSLAGTAVEWYDFFLYGTASALVFPHVFFPEADPLMGTLLALSTYAVGFVARPVGAAILGNLGDRKGRKATLVWSLMLMGVATVIIGLLPSYGSVGVASPLLLLLMRLIQGFALGGEWGGAVLFSSEHGGRANRAFWTSWPSIGPPLGNLLASGVLAVLSSVLPESQFLSWGWRIAFVLSALLVLIGLFLRTRVRETPLFEGLDQAQPASASRQPVVLALKYHWRKIILAALARFGDNASFYICTVFIITYTTEIRHFESGNVLNSVTIGMSICVVTLPLYAILADRIGRRPLLIFSSVLYIVWPFAFFRLVDTGGFSAILIAVIVALLAHAISDAVIAPMYSEIFPTQVRYSAVSIAYNVASVFAGSLAPIIAIALYSYFGSPVAIAIYVAAMGAVSLVASILLKETRDVDLAKVGAHT